MKMNKIYVAKKDGETLPVQRRRIANAIVDTLSSDQQLREEVAIRLRLDHCPNILSLDYQLHNETPYGIKSDEPFVEV